MRTGSAPLCNTPATPPAPVHRMGLCRGTSRAVLTSLCTDRETEGLALTALVMFFILSAFTYSSWENLLEVQRYPVSKRTRTRTKSAVFLFGILSKRLRDLLELGELGAEPGLSPMLQPLWYTGGFPGHTALVM